MTDALPRSFALVMLVALGSTSGIAGAQQVRLRIGHDQPVGTMYDEGHTMFLVLPRLLVPAWVQ